MSLHAELLERREEILAVAARHGARTVRIFGSVARDEETPESDLDLLVEFEPGRSLLDHIVLAQDLEDLLGREVDVVTEGGLHWYVRDRISPEAVPL
ncbi:nucleotidyltransferase family protein [Methanoculleus chikugoensis]|uniref:protein adenylyltransferase n=1 Tax=Methanoculleus chikugoensis TaxID=118126 RepID=A0ABN5XHM3_9EURY|nr:nucleotidyltransferase family protein [Methanoculleus chikugoensis]BBL68236.1 nucleotidyltransferase [Methanoculleus chikugoensis]